MSITPDRQRNLWGVPAELPEPSRENPVAKEIKRLDANARRVLERLRHGPATNWELSVKEIGGLSATRRARALRESGYNITVERVDASGTFIYTLVSEPASE